ncbi:MAG TPA: amino acid permease [Myxococcaceae bacterium]|nr:amino acid permease [Myxococcaceae bacterium]
MPRERRLLGLWPGVGLVVANMIGAGVFLSTGFMAQDLGPGAILAAWAVGALIALAGATAYSAVSTVIPRSGGEYRFLSELIHPAVGYVAGWTSLLVGFSAPVAVDAVAAGSFAQTLWQGLDPRWVGAGLVALLTAAHAIGLSSSQWTQNLLVVLKSSLVVCFTAVGLLAGKHAWPTWQPAHHSDSFPLAPFMGSLFYIAFAFSGWNAAVYATEEFKEPRRTVPRAMLIGCALVAILYLLMNWVFVANLTPEQASGVFAYESKRITLGHPIMKGLIGDLGARLMSLVAIALFISAMSAMIFAGPRIYGAMAEDGFLPRIFRAEQNRPPAGSIILQGVLSVVLIFTHPLQQVLQNIGAVLTLFAALTCLSLFRIRFGRTGLPPPPLAALAAASIFALSAAWMLYFGFRNSPLLVAWIAVILVVSLGAYQFTIRRRRIA